MNENDDKGFAVWLTGLPASGKTTLAHALGDALQRRGAQFQILDSDDLRQVLTPEPTYSREERDWFYQVMAYIGQLLTQNGINVIFAATANRYAHREQARELIQEFMEVFVCCSLETCIARDEKGVYQKAFSGEATTVPGIQAPYEITAPPDLTVNTEEDTPQACAGAVISRLEELGFLTRREASIPDRRHPR